MPIRQFSLYLSTTTPTQFSRNAPISVFKTTTANNATWGINWDALFGQYRTGLMRVKYQLQGTTSSTAVWNNANGTLRALKGLSSNGQQIYNGLVLGLFQQFTGTLPNTDAYIYGDTTNSLGIECLIPKGYSELQLALVNAAEIQTSLTTDWNVLLFFEVDEDKNSKELLGEI